MNKYFCSVFANENTSNLTELESLICPFLGNTSIESLNISEEDVYDELCKIDPSKASGPDEIPGKILKQYAHWLSELLTKLFTMSLQTGKLPQDWRSANIAPVFKSGNKHNPSNYRPISLTSLVIKVMEKLVHKNISEYLSQNNLLSPAQHGFRKHHSCQTQLLSTVHDWAKYLDNRSSAHCVFLDFTKAFD